MATALTQPTTLTPRAATPPRTPPGRALRKLAARRAALTAHNPRQVAVPLVGPALLALVVAPALKVATGGLNSHIDYTSFVGVGAVGLVVPLSCIFAGLSVIVDRHSGAQRELLAAPIPRGFLVLGNLIVALALSALQVAVLIGLSAIRGGEFHITGSATEPPDRRTEPEHLEQLSAALDTLADRDPDLAQLVDLRFFCGFSFAELAQVRGVSERTLHRHWRTARLLLHRELQGL